MYEQVENPKENKSRTVANSVMQKKSNRRQGFGLVDNRLEAVGQRKSLEMANNSPRKKQAAQLQSMTNHDSFQQQNPVQKKENKTGLSVPSRFCSWGESRVVQRVGKVGEQPQAFDTQLSSRMSDMWIEAGLQDNATLEARLMTEIVQMGGSAAPNTFTQVGDVVKKAIHDSWPAFADGLDTFYGTIVANIAAVWNANNRGFPLDVCVNYFERKVNNRANTLIDKQIRNSHNEELIKASNGLRFDHFETGALKFSKLARNFNQHSEVDVNTPYKDMSSREKEKLSEALKTMPVVNEILSGDIKELNIEKLNQINYQAPHANFRKWLFPTIEEKDENALNSEVVKSINVAMKKIVNMIDPELLSHLPLPKIYVHKNKSLGLFDKIRDPQKGQFRAFANRQELAIHIAENETDEVIVHEMGHQLEFFLGTEHWMRIQKLIRGRHTQAGGDGNLKSIYPESRDPKVKEEAAYLSKEEPATGTYSMKYYSDGATEVFSMSMEYFGNPENAKKLITNDPLQAAIILEAIQPKQLRAVIPFELMDFFPHMFIEMK